MRRSDLTPDCGSCAALCCVTLSFQRSLAFAFDKPAGERCKHVTVDYRCRIHAQLAERGLPGCAAFDCFGAGQRVTRAFATAPADGADGDGIEAARSRAFLVLRGVHEVIWLLTEAAKLCPEANTELTAGLANAIAALDALAAGSYEQLAELEPGAWLAAARSLLRRVGTALGGRRAGVTSRQPGALCATTRAESL